MKGSCQCGNVTYEIPDDYIALAACYCTECQKVSTGIGTYSMFLASTSFRLTSGELCSWERSSDSGARNIAWFCPVCSNRIYHQNPELPEIIRLKAGTLDNARELEPDIHCWTRSAPGWFQLPDDALVYATQPTMEEGMLAIAERRKNAADPA